MDLTKQIYSECFNPKKVKIYDGIKKTYEERYVPCGKCYHCRITRVNEWVTRMQLQSMQSLHTYFITLTYSTYAPIQILKECDAVVHNYNVDHKMQLSPLVLNKKHVQNFFKRLRKNTDKCCQYFCCGEYGDRYARPHYHIILWSDLPFIAQEIQNAWSLNNVPIGNIDFQDMNTEAINITHSFKYVCKYVQKVEFDFNKLVTRKLHENNCKKNYAGVHPKYKFLNEFQPESNLREDFNHVVTRDEFFKNYMEKCMYEYKKMFGPFFLCSKKPAIGFDYFNQNKERFAKQDYRIFELQGADIFPAYFIRKTKEYFCPYKTISVENGKPNTYSNIPNVLSLLVDLQNCISFHEHINSRDQEMQYYNYPVADYLPNYNEGQYYVRFSTPKYSTVEDLILPQRYFCFYDCKNKLTYSLAADFMYNVCDSRKNVIYRVPIDVVIKEVQATYDNLLHNYLMPMFYNSEFKRKEKLDAINAQFGSMEEYLKQKELCQRNLLAVINERQELYKKRKTLF